MTKEKNWFYLIDGIRGVAIVNMVLFHFLYDVFIVFGRNAVWYNLVPIRVWQQFICMTFIFISGISFHFSRNNLKRGVILNLYGIGITIITGLFMPSETVLFGILNLLGCAVLLTSLFEKWFKKGNAAIGLFVSLLLFTLFKNIQYGYLGLGNTSLVQIPDWIYQMKIFTFLGMPYPGFSSSDFFPVLPWFFLFLSGYYFWNIVAEKSAILSIFRRKVPVFSWLGSKSIWIYLIHQPLNMLICNILFH